MESKSIFLSVTFWGLVVTVLGQAAGRYGITIDQAGMTNDLVSLAGVGLSLYGRLRASQPVHVIPPEVKP